jgi:WD40 repeat protein
MLSPVTEMARWFSFQVTVLCLTANSVGIGENTMGIIRKTVPPSLALFVVFCCAGTLTAQNSACKVDPPSFATNSPNIFNDGQEQDLGDALAEFVESKVRVAPPATDDQLTRIGERLLATLPLTEIHYRFRIYDSGEINAFSIAGGNVYISRKLIAAVKSEDELAGVIAHEIGHVSTHQSAIEITRIFRLRLGITQVTDRADIFAKVHLMLNTPPKDVEEAPKNDKNELVADRVALYAIAKAGYAVETAPSLYNQISMNKGKTGNWLTDILGGADEPSQRYRSALKLIDALPTGCKGRQPQSSDVFRAWYKAAVEERVKLVAEGVSGDNPLKLDQPLRPNLSHIRFSPDGRYVLAQDEGSITVVDKASAKVLFRIDAPDVEAAQFTPDSGSVVFHDRKLRVEKWSVATSQRMSVKELVVFGGCEQTLLTPDGKTMVCTSLSFPDNIPRLDLRLIDVESGKPFYEEPKFLYGLMYFPAYNNLSIALEALIGVNLVEMQISPDDRYLLAVANKRVLAYDLEQRQQIKLGGDLKNLSQTRMSFLGPDQIFVESEYKNKDLQKARILTFPGGELVKDTVIGDQYIEAVSKGRYLIIGPLKNYTAGILDPDQNKILATSKYSTLDAWAQSIATEDPKGGLDLFELNVPGSKWTSLAVGPLPNPRAAEFSPDGKYLAVSVKSRGEIWDLSSGKKVGLTRPFRSVWFDEGDNLFGQFPKYMEQEPTELRITMTPLGSTDLAKYEWEDRQYHNLQYRFNPMGKEDSTSQHATLEVKKMETQEVAWSWDFPHETPACWPAGGNRLVLAWDLGDETAKSEIKSFPDLHRQVNALKDKKKGILVETVNAETGAPLEQMIVPDADLSYGFEDTRRATVSGEFVLMRGERDNTAIYRLDSGAKVGEFFGLVVAADGAAGLIAAENREGEILLVDEHSGKELKRFTLGSPVRLAQMVTGKENALLVLTADQVVHRLPLPQRTESAIVKPIQPQSF